MANKIHINDPIFTGYSFQIEQDIEKKELLLRKILKSGKEVLLGWRSFSTEELMTKYSDIKVGWCKSHIEKKKMNMQKQKPKKEEISIEDRGPLFMI